MKNFLVLSLLFASGLAHAASAGAKLSGEYLLLSENCLPPIQDSVSPHTLVIKADDSQIQVELPVLFQGSVMNELIDTMQVGDSTDTMLGGSQYRIVGTYASDGTSFKYQEFDNQFPHGPMSLLRTKTLVLTGDQLVLTYAEEGLAARQCLLQRK